MNKLIITFLTLSFSINSLGQINIHEKYFQADTLFNSNKFQDAYNIYKEIKPLADKNDTLYNHIVWNYVVATSKLEYQFRIREDYKNSLLYGLEALKLIKDNKDNFGKKFAEKEQWMIKSIIVSYFGLDQLTEAQKYKEILYNGYKDKSLPEGIDGFFNFDFFKLNNKNIWGYEWYPELPSNRYSSSFTKVVYYVYSTQPDGTDKDQLFRFHVLMFHGDGELAYILERQYEEGNSTISGSYYQYRYKENIDYLKLRKDIIEIVSKDIEPSSKRITPKW